MKKLSAVREENGCREFFIAKQTIIFDFDLPTHTSGREWA